MKELMSDVFMWLGIMAVMLYVFECAEFVYRFIALS